MLVCGCGRMGQHHVRAVNSSPTFELVGVCDPDPLARAWAHSQGIRTQSALSEALERFRPDAVIVATPPSQHEICLQDCLAARCAVLVEKPLSPESSTSQRLLGAFAQAGVLLAPAMVERFNPAALALQRLLPEWGPVRSLEVLRQGGREPMDRSISVGLDLAIHDLDLLGRIFGGVPDWSSFQAAPGTMECAGSIGAMPVALSARWAQQALRRWSLDTASGDAVADLQARQVWLDGSEVPCEGKDSLDALLDWFAGCLEGDRRDLGWGPLLEIQRSLEDQPITATASISTLTSLGNRPTSMVERAGA